MIGSFKEKNTENLFSGNFVKEFSGFQRQAIRRLQILDSVTSLNEKRRITSDTALRMSRFFGTSAEFWMNLQQAYDLKITREEKWAEIEMSVRPLCVNA